MRTKPLVRKDQFKLVQMFVLFFILSVEFVERVWDPLSMKQGSRLIKMIKNLQEEYPTVNLEGENTQVITCTATTTSSNCSTPTGSAGCCCASVQRSDQ